MSPAGGPPKQVGRPAINVLAVGALILTGCQQDRGDEATEAHSTCDLISTESLAQITGTDDLFVTGGHLDEAERSYLSCDVLTTGSPEDLVRILAYDISGTEARNNARDAREGQQDAGSCDDITTLADDRGYLCQRSDRSQVDASVALDERLVRFTFYEGSQLDAVSPEAVQAWAEEVDARIRQLDDEADES